MAAKEKEMQRWRLYTASYGWMFIVEKNSSINRPKLLGAQFVRPANNGTSLDAERFPLSERSSFVSTCKNDVIISFAIVSRSYINVANV